MAITPLNGSTGFEVGSITMFATIDRSTTNTDYVNISTTQKHTGSYGLLTRNSSGSAQWAQRAVPGTPAEIYVGIWAKPYRYEAGYTAWGYGRIQIMVGGSAVVELRCDATQYWDAYVNGSKVADGAIQAADDWHFIELHVLVDNSGSIATRIDGTPDIDYSGDTQPGADTAITHVRLACYPPAAPHTTSWWWDDLTIGTGDWPGDLRYEAIVPTSDSSVEWTPSTGVDNYALVDEIPPSDADYVSAGSNLYQDMYGFGAWSPSATQGPEFVVQWMRAQKDTANQQGASLALESNGTEDSSGSFALTTSWAYYSRIVAQDPDGPQAWTTAAVNALTAGQIAVI